MKEGEARRHPYYEAKAAYNRAKTEFHKIANVHRRLWQENHARDSGTEPSEEFQRVTRAYEVASVALTEARENLQSLQGTLPIRGSKPFKYGAVPDADEGDEPDTA